MGWFCPWEVVNVTFFGGRNRVNDTFVSCHFWSTLFTNIEPKFQTLISKRTGFDTEVAEKFFNGIYCVDISCLMQCYLLWKVSFIFKVQKEKKEQKGKFLDALNMATALYLAVFIQHILSRFFLFFTFSPDFSKLLPHFDRLYQKIVKTANLKPQSAKEWMILPRYLYISY